MIGRIICAADGWVEAVRTLGPLLVGVVALLLSFYALARELPVLAYGDQRSIDTTVALVQGDLGGAFSFYGQKRLMASCVQGMTGRWSVLAPLEQRRTLARNCLGHALSFAEATPVEALTWVVASRASFLLGNSEEMNRYLQYAWHAGPNEQWVAGLRVNLAQEAIGILSESNQRRHDSDLSVMVMSRNGISAIAARYWSDQVFRDRITRIVEAMPPEDQRRFIASVRRAAMN